MPGRDDVCSWVELNDLVKELQSRLIIPIGLKHLFLHALLIASVRSSLAIAYLSPKIWATLSTTARSEEVVVIFVVT